MHVVDANTCFGRRTDLDCDLSMKALLAEMDEHHIACAVTCSLRGVHYDPKAGNTETLDAARNASQLIPAGTLDLRASLGWEKEVDRCLRAGIRAFRFFPEEQGWSVSSLLFRRVLERLCSAPCTLVISTAGSWGRAEEIARATAEARLPVLLTDTSYGNMADVISVMQAYPHLCAETNWLATVGAMDVMAKEVGADRLLYGSSAPLRPMQKALNEVLESGLSHDDKAAILGGNAVRLFGLAVDRLDGLPEFTEFDPQVFHEESIDVHSHLGTWRFPIPEENYDPVPMIRRMKRFGISHSIVSSYEGMRYDIEVANRAIAEAIGGRPELRGYVELNPHQFERSCREMDRYYARPGFVGAELELSHTVCPTGSDEVRRLMAEIAKRGKPVLFMPAGAGDAAAERDLARQNPNLAIIHAHGMDVRWARVIADTPNIYVEFCLSRPCHHHIRDCLKLLGPERILFGTDQTLLSVGAAVGLYLDARLTAAEQRLVLSENARRIFRL